MLKKMKMAQLKYKKWIIIFSGMSFVAYCISFNLNQKIEKDLQKNVFSIIKNKFKN